MTDVEHNGDEVKRNKISIEWNETIVEQNESIVGQNEMELLLNEGRTKVRQMSDKREMKIQRNFDKNPTKVKQTSTRCH